jgi:hypothetical protein
VQEMDASFSLPVGHKAIGECRLWKLQNLSLVCHTFKCVGFYTEMRDNVIFNSR